MTEAIWLLKPAVVAFHGMMIAEFGGSAGLRDEGLLDSALARPRHLFHYESRTNLPRLAAFYAAAIIGNRPFVDGNKRVGFMAAYVFLGRNGLELTADEAAATVMTMALAAGEIDEAGYGDWLAQNTSPSRGH